MLELIHQNGLQKIITAVYYVEPPYSSEEEDAESSSIYATTIYALVSDYGMIPVAQYDKLEDARAVFAHLVTLEGEHGLAVLPKDDPAEIQEFLLSDGSIGYFLKKITK